MDAQPVDEGVAIWEQVRAEVHLLESELGGLERDANEKQHALAELRSSQFSRAPEAGRDAAEILKALMGELREAQTGMKTESERLLQLSEEIDQNNTSLYQASTRNHTVKNEREAAAQQLASLAHEQRELSSQLTGLLREEQDGEGELRQLEQMQHATTARLHEAQASEMASQGENVAVELAELEGLRALVPHLAYEVDQTMSVVQRKNQLLCEKIQERAKLQQDVEALSGVNALAAAGAAPPYSEQLLALLSAEYATVQQLQEEVKGSGLAFAEENQAIAREISVATAETSNIHVEKEGLMRQLEAGTARIEQLHARSEQIQAGTEAAGRRTEELGKQLGRGDEIMAGRLRKMQRQLVVKRQVRDHQRHATAEITARHRAMKDQQIDEMRASIAEQEAELHVQLEQNGIGRHALWGSPVNPRQGFRGGAASSFRQGGAPAGSAGSFQQGYGGAGGLASPPSGRGPFRFGGSAVSQALGAPPGGGSAEAAAASVSSFRVAPQSARIADLLSKDNNPTVRAAAEKVMLQLSRDLR